MRQKRSPSKVLLTTFSGAPTSFNFFIPDPGLALLAGVLKANGYTPIIIDFNSLEHLEDTFNRNDLTEHFMQTSDFSDRNSNNAKSEDFYALKSEFTAIFLRNSEERIFESLKTKITETKSKLLCIKPWLGPSLEIFLKISKRLKNLFPGLTIALGGPSISSIDKEALPFLSEVDFITFGKGEQAILSILDVVNGKKEPENVENTYFLNEDKKYQYGTHSTQRTLTTPASPLYDPDVYLGIAEQKLPLFIVEDSRGCYFSCAFCTHPNKSDNSVIENPVENTFKQFQSLHQQFGSTTFRLSGSCPPPRLFNHLSKMIIESNQTFRIGAFFHSAFTPHVDFKAMAKAGFTALLTGIESTDESTRVNFFKKNLNLQHLNLLGNLAGKNGIFINQSLIIPTPGDSLSHLRAYISKYPFQKDLSSISVSFPKIFPETDWWSSSNSYGIEISSRSAYLKYLLFGKSENEARPQSLALTINNKTHQQLVSEFITAKKTILSSGVQLDFSDELSLMAAALKLPNSAFQKIQSTAIGLFDLPKIVTLFSDLKTCLTSSPKNTRSFQYLPQESEHV
ncbi:hypothetical protein WDW86_06405 [Bdellovibrionota bacterium FG-2]